MSVKKWSHGLFLMSIGFVMSCQQPVQQENGMTKFVNDAQFVKAHELPKKIDYKSRGDMVTFKAVDGSDVKAYEVRMEGAKANLIIIHEWWGLNDHIRQEADRLSNALNAPINVLAVDMYDGAVATDAEMAGKLMKSVGEERALAILGGALDYAEVNMGADGMTLPLGTLGWCFGGGWSLRASVLAGERSRACVVYYGALVKDAAELVRLEAKTLGIFAKQDKWITPDAVAAFDGLAKSLNKSFEYEIYDADHAFANPSGSRYNERAAQEANEKVVDFLNTALFF